MVMEKRTIPAAGEFYRHFKGKLYQIIGVAKHSETMEQMVVYQALYGDFGLYTRPLELFLGKVNKDKYPEAGQEYRFEKCVPGGPCEQVQPVIKAAEIATDDEETVRPEILRFLDAEGAEAKLKVLRELRMDLDESLMTTIELSLDLLPDDKESLERRFDFAERTLEQRIRFEGSRLR
jgi:hypothetical protein